MSPAGVPLANFGDRFLAYLLDSAVVMLAAMVIMVPAGIVFWLTIADPFFTSQFELGSTSQTDFIGDFLIPLLLLEAALILIMMALVYVYTVEMMIRTGQTIGKRVMKLKIVPLDPAAAMTRGTAARRWLIQYVVGGFVPGFSYLDGLWQLWDKPYQQCLHDKFAQTVVVKVPS